MSRTRVGGYGHNPNWTHNDKEAKFCREHLPCKTIDPKTGKVLSVVTKHQTKKKKISRGKAKSALLGLNKSELKAMLKEVQANG